MMTWREAFAEVCRNGIDHGELYDFVYFGMHKEYDEEEIKREFEKLFGEPLFIED